MVDPHHKELYKRPYNRPNEKWVCGRSADGRPCPQGPSNKGRCDAGHECAPAKLGDRWVCTRPEQYGGPCDSPALPNPSFGPQVENGVGTCCKPVSCTPQRSLRSLRGRFSKVLALVLVGGILTALGGAWRNTFMSPGPLTLGHQGASMASLEDLEHGKLAGDERDGGSAESCHICHTGMDGGLKGLLDSALTAKASPAQSSQCLACHDEDVGENALFTHALAPDMLDIHTAEAGKEPFGASKPLSLALASYSPGVKQGDEGQLACAACHREHNGASFDLKRMDSHKCQTCHVKQFKSIANGHPEFSTAATASGYDYPYRRRTRIVYDHERHETNYFQKEENLTRVPADCSACHEIEANAYSTRLKPFEQMCASCHTGNIVSARDQWIHVFGFPSLESDVYEILEDELDLPAVPRTASKSMSPFMALLLAGYNAQDPESATAYAEDLAMLMEFENDLSGIAYDEDPEIVGRIFEGLKYLQGAAMNGEQGGLRRAVIDQLERLSGEPISPRALDAMFGFPKPGATVTKVMENVSRKDIVEMAGWHVEDSDFRMDGAAWTACLEEVAAFDALNKALDGGDGGPFQQVLELTGKYRDFRAWFDDHIEIVGEDWILTSSGKKVKNKEWKALIAEIAGGIPEAPKTEEADTETAEEESADESDDAAEDQPAAEPKPASASLQEAGDAYVAWLGDLSKVKKWLNKTTDTTGDAWSLRAPQSLFYRPLNHADPFITEWLNFTAPLYAENPAAALVFDELSGRKTGSGVGACMKCHSIDAEKNSAGQPAIKINWKSGSSGSDFTKFDHTPHMKLMNCAECHRASWKPAERLQMTLAKAASAEEEAPAAVESTDAAPEATEAAPAETEAAPEATEAAPEPTEAAPEPTEAAPEPTEAAEETIVEPATPAMAYLDGFKAGSEGLELGVNFSNDAHGAGSHAFVSNFAPIAKDDCTRCHVKSKAGDSCLICHNYHIQESNRSLGIQSLRELIETKVAVAEEVAQ